MLVLCWVSHSTIHGSSGGSPAIGLYCLRDFASWDHTSETWFYHLNLVFLVQLVSFLELCYAKSLQSCPTLCNPIDGSPPGSPIPGILQARTLEWVAISLSLQRKKGKSESEVAQLCPTPSDPMDCSLPGSSVHGILQARVLEWGAMSRQVQLLISNGGKKM